MAYAMPSAMLSGERVLLESLLAVAPFVLDTFFLWIFWGGVYREWKLAARGEPNADRRRLVLGCVRIDRFVTDPSTTKNDQRRPSRRDVAAAPATSARAAVGRDAREVLL